MKRHAVIVSIKVEHRNLKIARFLKFTGSIVCKVRKELKENNRDEIGMSKKIQHWQHSDPLRIPSFFFRRMHGMIDKNPGKSMQHFFKDLQVSEKTIRKVVYQDLRYKSYILR